MDVTSIIKKLDISTFKCFVLRIFGGAGAVYEYIANKANNAVNALMLANEDKVQYIREKMALINGYAVKYAKFLPMSWIPYAEHLNNCFLAVYNASEDNRITPEERKLIVDSFRIAYADYMAD